MKKLNKKVIATLLVVSQIITSAGMATFAATFTKISGDALSSTTESDDLYTRYYEEFLYESKTYLYNDSDDSVGASDNSVGASDDNVGASEDVGASTRPSELLSSESEESATKSPWGTSPEDETETTTVKASDDLVGASDDSVGASDDSVGASTASPEIEDEETTDIYDEEPEEDPEDYPEEPEEDETTIEETEETTIDETESESNVEESETDDEARETRPYDDEESGARETRPYDETTEDVVESIEESVEASTRPSELLSSESEESATKSPWGTSPEDETYDTTIESSEDVVESSEESVGASFTSPEETTTSDPELATSSEIEETEEESSEALLELESIVATESELFNLEPLIASESESMLFGDLLGAAPIGGDGTHVHKICGVAEGAPCLHTEVAEHTEVGDYRLIAVDEYEIMAEIIDNLIGRVDDGQGNYEYITEPEYLVLGRDIEFDKSVSGNPRDADTTNDFYSLDIKRDLYLCLNGHSIKNFTWGSSSNKQIFITNCGAPAEVSAVNLPANWIIISSNTKFFGVNKNIIVKAGRLALINNAERAKSTFFGTIFDGYNTVTGVQNVFDYAYDVPGHVLTFEDCEIRNYKNDAGTAQAVALIYMRTKGALVLKNVKIYGNDGIRDHIFIMGNTSSQGKLTTKGRCEIYNNNMSTGTSPTSFLNTTRTTFTIEDEGLFIYNNSKTPGHCYINASTNAIVNINEGATLSIDNNKLAKNTANNHTIFVYMAATINVRGNFYITNNKIINCGTSNTGEALAGLWSVKDCIVNIGNGIVKICDNKAYKDDCQNPADDKTYKAQHLYQVYVSSKDTSTTFKMYDGYKFNPANRIGPVGFPSGQSGKIMKFTTNEVDDPSIVDTVFKVDNYYFKDYVVEVKDDYARAVHKESNHKHKECGVAVGTPCTHVEVAAHTEEIMYYELSGDLAISGRIELIKGFSSSDATEYFYLTDDIDNSEGSLISITLLRDVYICLNGHSMKGVRFAKCTKTVHICNCQNNTVTLRTASAGKEAYMFDCSAYLYGKQNKNIRLNTYGVGRIASGYASKIYIYGTNIDAENTTGYTDRSRAYVNVNGGHFIMENVNLYNCHTTTERFMYVRGDDKGGGSFTIRDVNSYNMSKIVYTLVRLGGKSNKNGTFTIKGNCKFENIVCENGSSNIVGFDTYSSMILDEGATLTFAGNTLKSTANSLFVADGANAKFIMREGSKLIIDNNVFYKTNKNQGFLMFQSGTHDLLGEVIITNNSFYNCQGVTSDYIGAFLASKDANITIGSGKIFIDNNKAYLDEGSTLVDDRAVPQHHMYGFITGKTDLALIQSPGTKFSPETYIPNFAFMGYAAGTVAKWTSNEYEEYYKASFSELVIADTTYTPDFKVVYEENNLVVKSASNHFHKVCGVGETDTCQHTEISEHTENIQWSGARVDSVDAFVQSLTGTDGATGSSYYYLSDDIVASAITTITPKRDVYLCLNGHDLKNFVFKGTKSIYITNCQTKLATIENTTTNLIFNANVYIYGINKNILFSSNRVCDVNNNNTESHFYNLVVDGQKTTSGGDYSTFYLKNDATVRNLILEDVTVINVADVWSVLYFEPTTTSSKGVVKNMEIKDCSTKGGALIHINNSVTVDFKGKNEFHNNVHTGAKSMFYFNTAGGVTIYDEGMYIYDNVTTGTGNANTHLSKKITLEENAILSIVNNTLNKNNGALTTIVGVADGIDWNIKGDLEIRDNNIINAGTQANNLVSGVWIEAKNSLNIGSGKITIKDNKCYSDNKVNLADDSNYVAQHMFNLLSVSKDVNLFNVIDGCKLNPESRIDGAAFYSATGAGQIMEWNSNVTDDLNSYDDIFIADKFFNPILDKRVENGILLLDYSAAAEEVHKHKLCGISTRSACTHTETAAHTEGISYKPLGPNVVKDPTIMSVLLVDSSGKSTKPNCFYLIEDLINTGDTIQTAFTVDTYICLNGHTIKGFELRANSTSTMNVTNCSSTMGKIDLKGAKTIAFTTNTRAYGVNKNITIYAPRLCWASTNLNEFYSFIMDGTGSSGYSTDQWGIIHGAGDNASIKMEKVEMKNIQSAWSIVDLPSRKNFEMVMKDVAFKNCKIVDVPFYIVGTDNTLKLTIKGTCEITDNNFVKSGNTNGVFQLKNARLTLNQNSTLKISDNTMTNHGRIMFLDSGYFYADANSNFVVTGNKFNKNTSTSINSGNTELVQIGAANNCTMLGNVTITDNKIVDCGTNTVGTYMSALSLYGTNNTITVGNGNITVNNNKAYSNEEGTTEANDTTYKNHHLYQVYSYNTSLVFNQASGTKFNTGSRVTVTMQGISEGKVIDWNSNTTDNVAAYSSIFSTDYFGDEDPMLVVYKNDSVQLVSSSNYHFHKICGAATSSNCSHTLVTTSHENVEFSRLGSSINADSFVSLIKGVAGGAPEYFYLRGDITTSSEKEIALQRDVYLCLNGHNISGFRFTGNGKKIYICNCRNEKVSTIKNVLSTNMMFATNVQIYGSTRSNVVVNSGRIIDVTTTYANDRVSFYNVDFDGTGAKDIIWKSGKTTYEATTFYLAAYTTNFENVKISNYINNKRFLIEAVGSTVNFKNVGLYDNRKVKWSMIKIGTDTYKATLNIEGKVELLRNESYQSSENFFFYTCGDINVKDNASLLFKKNLTGNNRALMAFFQNGCLTTGENSYFGLVENVVEKFTGADNTGLIYIDDKAKDMTIKGDFEMKDNRIAKCGTSTSGNFVYGLYLATNRFVNIGSGKITIQNNKSYSDLDKTLADDTKYKAQHMYQVYADHSTHKTNGLFKVISGKKFNTESRIEGVAYNAYNYNGNVIKWDSTTVDDADIDKFNEVFTADAFKDDELSIGYDATNGWVILEFGAPKHRHKLCGVATTSACLHNDLISHNDEIGYRKITSEADRTTLTNSFAQGGAFVLLDDIDPAKIGDGGAKNIDVTVSNDLYLCLNGHSLKGIRFLNGTAKTIYITNCASGKGTVQYGVNETQLVTNISLEIYGINKNIEVKQDRLAYLNGAASSNQRVRLYSVKLASNTGNAVTDSFIYMANGSSNASFVEDCEFTKLNSYALVNAIGDRTFNFKNISITNSKFSNYLLSFDKGTTKVRFDGENKINNIKYANTASDYFIHFGSYAGNEVVVNGNLSITNCESYYNANHFFHVGGGIFTVEDKSNLYVNKNKLYNTAIYGRALLYFGNNAEFNLYGCLEIKNNEFVGTRQSHSDAGLWYGNSSKPINIGSTSIVIKDNSTTNERANIRNLYSYYAGADGIFKQAAGTKFNALLSMVDSVAINSEDYTGVVYENWDSNYVHGLGEVQYKEIFKADTYGGRKGIITAKDGEKIIVTFGDHFHKICGTLATMSCVHEGISDHGIGTTDDIMHTYLALRWDSMPELANKLSLGGEYFLIRKIKFDTPTVIDLREDLFLCLTSYYVENAIFTSSTGKKAYISTCIEQFEEQEDEEEEEQDYDEFGQPIPSPTANMGSKRNDRHEVALVATESNVDAMFKCGVEIYSPFNLINVYANEFISTDLSGEHSVLRGVNLYNDKTSGGKDYITLGDNDSLTISQVEISTLSNVGYLVNGKNATLNVAGVNNIFSNDITKGMFNLGAINQTSGSINIKNNTITRMAGEQNFIKVASESYLLGDLIVTNNKVVYANVTNDDGRLTILNVSTPGFINIGNSKLYTNKNFVYSDNGSNKVDEELYLNHHLYDIFSNAFDGVFVQVDGTYMNTTTRIKAAFAEPKYMGVLVKNWPLDNACESMFEPDRTTDAITPTFNRAITSVSYDEEINAVVLDNVIRITFLCGLNDEMIRRLEGSGIAKDKAEWGMPYELRDDIFRIRLRKWYISSYVDQHGKTYRTGYYETGLPANTGRLTLTAQWSFIPNKDEWITEESNIKPKNVFERNAVLINGEWELNKLTGTWMYYMNASGPILEGLFPADNAGEYFAMSGTDTTGYLRKGTYQIFYDGQPYYFTFDENGKMLTGFVTINDGIYYFREEGHLKGAMQIFPMVVGTKRYIFDIYGRLARIEDTVTNEIQSVQSTYQKLVGVDDYYPEIPSVVGWSEQRLKEYYNTQINWDPLIKS